jgi:predicted ATP-dependent Lon-type protease
MREMRKRNFSDADRPLLQARPGPEPARHHRREAHRVRPAEAAVSHRDYDKEAVRRCLEYALEARRRVKEQLKKIGGMEFFDVHFSYIDLETNEEKFVVVQEQGGDNLAESLQVAADAGAKRILLPMASVADIPTIPGELFAKFQTSFYADAKDAVFKGLGVQ